jgi:hypothetical protein
LNDIKIVEAVGVMKLPDAEVDDVPAPVINLSEQDREMLQRIECKLDDVLRMCKRNGRRAISVRHEISSDCGIVTNEGSGV